MALHMEHPAGLDLDPFAFEAVTVDATAGGVALTAATYAPSNAGAALKAFVTNETGEIRYMLDGATTVTSTVGHLLGIGDSLVLQSPNAIRRFRGIRTGGTSGALKVTYYR